MDKPLWGLRVLKFDGAIAPRVLRFDAPPARGLWWAPYIYRRRPLMIKPNNRAFARGKTIQPPCGRRKCNPPLVAGATTFPPRWEACHLILSRLRLFANQVTRFPVEKVRRSRKGGGERSEPISRMPIMSYDTESKSRNADFMLIARKGDTTTLGPKGRQT